MNKVKRAVELRLKNALEEHNDNCLLCALKDTRINEVLALLTNPEFDGEAENSTIDKETKEYRMRQFTRISTVFSEYQPKIKILKPDGETNWLDITEEELEQIKVILTA